MCPPSCRLYVCFLRMPFVDPLANFGNVGKPNQMRLPWLSTSCDHSSDNWRLLQDIARAGRVFGQLKIAAMPGNRTNAKPPLLRSANMGVRGAALEQG